MNENTRDKLIKIARELCKEAKEAKARKDWEAHYLACGKMLGLLIALEHELAEAKETQVELEAEHAKLQAEHDKLTKEVG